MHVHDQRLHETQRMQALRRYEILDTPEEAAFGELVALAQKALDAPFAHLALFAGDRLWIKARAGEALATAPRELGFCGEAIKNRQTLVVPDAAADARFSTCPLVAGPPHLRFYAGAPLVTPDGFAIGTLAVLDQRPRALSAADRALLERLAALAMSTIELRRLHAQRAQRAAALESQAVQRFEVISRATSDVVWDWDLVTDAVWHSSNFRSIFGQGEELPTIRHWIERIHPQEVARVTASIRAAIDARSTNWSEEYRFLRADGTWADVLDRGNVLCDERGAPVRMVGSMMDVTARKRVERAQQALYRIAEAAGAPGTLQDLFRSIHQIVSELMPAPNLFIALRDPATGMVHFPYYVDEVDAQPPPLPPGVGVTALVLKGGAPVLLGPGDFERRRESGQFTAFGTAPIYWLGVPLRSGDQTFGALVAQSYSDAIRYDEADKERLQFVSTQVARAIERKQAEEALRESERRFRALVENNTDGFALVSADGHCLYQSHSSMRMMGYTFEETASYHIFEFVHPDDQEILVRAWTDVLRSPDARVAYQCRVRHRSGAFRVLEIVLANQLADPAVRGVVANFRDITDRKQLEGQLAAADRMASVGTLAAGVAHEINNPLAYIQANVHFALETLAEPSPRAIADACEALREAREGAERVRVIVRDLKTFSRPDSQRVGPVNVRDVLESSIHMAQNEIRHRARLVTALGATPAVAANDARLGQVFLNLLINAAQAIPEGDSERNEIGVATSTDAAGRAVISVRDTGCGMTPEVKRRIFDPFFTTKPVGVGTGLGLSICHGIIASLGGELLVESAPGKGSEFRVILPPAAADQSQPANDQPPAPAEARGRVLVIDDDQMVGRAVARSLGADHAVQVSTDAADALAGIARGARYDAIVCDLMMPGLDGMAVHEQLARLDPAQAERMIFLTGGAYTEAAREFLERVENARLEKPFDTAELRELVRGCVSVA